MNAVIGEVAEVALDRNAVPSSDDISSLWGAEELDAPLSGSSCTNIEQGLKGLILDLFSSMGVRRVITEEQDSW